MTRVTVLISPISPLPRLDFDENVPVIYSSDSLGSSEDSSLGYSHLLYEEQSGIWNSLGSLFMYFKEKTWWQQIIEGQRNWSYNQGAEVSLIGWQCLKFKKVWLHMTKILQRKMSVNSEKEALNKCGWCFMNHGTTTMKIKILG